jgi:hypothetical protein
MIDFQAATPRYVAQDSLVQPASQMQGVALPDGTVLVAGGVSGRPRGTTGWRNSFRYQRFDPSTGTVTPLVETNVPWHDHATMLLLPDGSVISMGGNRTDKVYFTDPLGVTCVAGQQCSSSQTRDAGVPVAQIYRPPYFFGGSRPVITRAPAELGYGERFEIRASAKVAAVAMIQQHPVTHNHQWNRRVELWFRQEDGNRLEVQGPRFPGVAPPGNYLLFVVDEGGVPSTGELIHLD